MNLFDQNDFAVAAVGAWISEAYPGSVEAELWRLQKHGYGAGVTGWTVPVSEGISLLVVVDERFPYTNPSTAVFGPRAPTEAPHVEKNHRLCTLGSTARIDSNDPVGVVREYIEQSVTLLADIEHGRHLEDFTVDFEAYWKRSQSRVQRVRTLIDWRAPSREAWCWIENDQIIVADDANRLRRWIESLFGRAFKDPPLPALFVWLDSLPLPNDYPSTVAQIRQLIKISANDALAAFEGLLASDNPVKCVVFAGQSSPGEIGTGAFILRLAREGGPRTDGRTKAIRGFRPGRVPQQIAQLATTATRASTLPLDAANTRLPAGQLTGIRDARVALIGCGALGSGVARLLVQSGIRDIKMFDPDVLGWENIGRHELGATAVGKNKALALAWELRHRLPDCEVVGYDRDWREILLRDEAFLADRDLVISTTADWGSDCALSDLQGREALACPVIFGWMERNAAAAHALALKGSMASLRSGFDETGNAKRPVTGWWKEEHLPGCGGATSAYGALELGTAQAFVAGLAVDIVLGGAAPPVWRVSITMTASLENAGGYWSTAFRTAVGDPGPGGRSYAMNW